MYKNPRWRTSSPPLRHLSGSPDPTSPPEATPHPNAIVPAVQEPPIVESAPKRKPCARSKPQEPSDAPTEIVRIFIVLPFSLIDLALYLVGVVFFIAGFALISQKPDRSVIYSAVVPLFLLGIITLLLAVGFTMAIIDIYKEKDRNFLIAYFAAVAAFIVLAVTLMDSPSVQSFATWIASASSSTPPAA